MTEEIILHHSPNTRSTGALTLLEEMGVPYRLHVLNMKAGENRAPGYLSINPMGKVPAITHRGALVTEQVAIFLYLADLFPEVGLAPTLKDPLRGPYLRWLVFYGSCFEPAIVDRAMKREPAPPGMSPYGDFETMMNTVRTQLAQGPYILGDRMTAADVLWGMGLAWITGFKLIPDDDVVLDYVARMTARPAVARAKAIDAELAAGQQPQD